VVWPSFDEQGRVGIHGAQRPAAGPWSESLPLSNNARTHPWDDDTRVAMDARGHAVVVWTEVNGSTPRVMVTTHR